MRVPTREKGRLEIFSIAESSEGKWEDGWEALRLTNIGSLISRVPRSALNHLLNGYSAPFVEALGIPPVGALQKLPSKACDRQRGCQLYQKRTCFVDSRKLPWCYEPAGFEELSPSAKRIAGDLVFLWKEEVYVIAIYDDHA